MSTPRMLRLPGGTRRVTIETSRGSFAALEATPATGVCERQPALLVPGYTGSKEDFLPLLESLAAAGRRVVAIDMRGQYETAGGTDPGEYQLPALAADVALVADDICRRDAPSPQAQRIHVLGHSFGGLVARELLLARAARASSLTLMSSGPGTLAGPRADFLRGILAGLDGAEPAGLAGEIKRIWDTHLEPQAVADGVPDEIVGFLRRRMLTSSAVGLKAMAEILLGCPDRTAALARLRGTPKLVVYGEDDDAWDPQTQEDMAARLDAKRVCIPGAAHSPAVEAPETVASVLTGFWNDVECGQRRR
ncbi:MAG: alpha/beta hydrolase [Actinobacteria bacterium]|nr:alpha/beta hydrolase [Actinomycetota bacterium]